MFLAHFCAFSTYFVVGVYWNMFCAETMHVVKAVKYLFHSLPPDMYDDMHGT